MPAKIDDHLAGPEAKLRQLEARRERLVAQREFMSQRRTRREETRRKVLVGAVVLANVEQGVISKATLRGWMAGALTDADDRALFGLKPVVR